MMAILGVALSLFPLALVARAQGHSWSSPAAIIPAFWGLALIAPLVAYSTVPIRSTPLSVLMLLAVVASVSALVVSNGGSSYMAMESRPANPRLLYLAMLGFLAGMVATSLILRQEGYSLAAAVDPDRYLIVANAVSVERYEGGAESPPVLVSLMLSLAYVACAVCPGFRLGPHRRRTGLLLYFPVFGLFLYSAASTARLPLLIGAGLSAGAVIGRNAGARGLSGAAVMRHASKTGALIALGATVFFAIGVARVGRVDLATLELVFGKMKLYAFGFLPAFSNWWVSTDGGSGDLGLGTASFAGVEYFTGQSRLATRSYNEFTTVTASGDQTNVYTAARGLITDFGLAGAVVCLLVCGAGAGILFRRARRRGSPTAVVCLAFFYCSLFLSPILSIFTFTNVTLAVPLALLAIKWVYASAVRNAMSDPSPPGLDRKRVSPQSGGHGPPVAS